MISGADRRPEKFFYSQMLFSFIFSFFYCLKVRFLLNKRGMEVCIIVFFFDAKKKLNKSQKKTTAASRPIFAKKKLRNAKKKLGASRRFCQKITLFSFFWQNFAKKKTLRVLLVRAMLRLWRDGRVQIGVISLLLKLEWKPPTF